ncbi:TetR/AcrR family transcriptional regulator [Acidimangrovimonas pyrenivorans]|uniref:TetR/AcrR family transcriptional regulator n=1 Tax=Acidimangrovimonas pyrenivorans TaxID=2030798 RepID=A0ABV7ACY8_9RHOB
MAATAEKVKRGRKFAQVLEGARQVFLRDGYEGANVDEIAREAGVSKATLYNYFPDKRLLFLEVAKAECQRQADEAVEFDDGSAPPDRVLFAAGRRIADFVVSDFGQGVFRICVAESDRFPEIGQEFYRSGPGLVRRRLADYLREAVARGDLEIDDIDLAADQFAELCKADIQTRRVFRLPGCRSGETLDRIVRGAVEMFMARYGVKKGQTKA